MIYRTIIKRIVALSGLASALFLPGCVKEVGIDTPGPGPADGEITITVRIPGQQTPSTRSMDGAAENTVKTIDILVFDYATGGGGAVTETFHKHVAGEVKEIKAPENAGDSYTATFSVKLEARNHVRLVLLANMGTFDFTPFTEGVTGKQDVLSALVFSNASKWMANGSSESGYKPVPMYGETDPDINITTSSRITNVNLHRMLARIDVVNAADADFKLKYIALANPYQSGFIAPNWNLTGNRQGQIIKPYSSEPNVQGYDSRPGTATQSPGLMTYVSYAGDAAEKITAYRGEIYTFESVAADKYTTSKDWDANSTALVLGGTIGSSTTMTYYRVDFTFPNTDPTVRPDYMALLRNYKYVVTIGEVSGNGYPSAELAARSKGMANNFKVTIHTYDEAELKHFVFDENHYLGAVAESIVLSPHAESKEMRCGTNDPSGWTIEGIVYEGSGTDWLTATKSGGNEMYADLTLAAGENNTGSLRKAVVNLRAGVLTFPITVMQTPAISGGGEQIGALTYVGAFWRKDQTGERLITIPVTGSGEFSVFVYEYGDDFNEGDILLGTDRSAAGAVGDSGAGTIDMNLAVNDRKYGVNTTATAITGTAGTVTANAIFFRVGLKNKWSDQPGYDPESKPARYAVIALNYGGKTQKIFLRQGEEADYLMRPQDPTGNNSLQDIGGGIYRPLTNKFLPYNLTAPEFRNGWTAGTSEPMGYRGGVMVDFPSQAGAFFQWANTTSNTRAFNPGIPNGATRVDHWGPNENVGWWGPNAPIYETCPQGYRRISDGSTTATVSNACPVEESEYTQSLYLNPLANNSPSLANSVWGYYADGFFDRLDIGQQTAYSGGKANTAVAANSARVAYIGRLFFNPTTYASLFIPAAGHRYNGGYLYNTGNTGQYWFTSSISGEYAWRMYLAADNAGRGSYSRVYAFPIRCVKE